MTNFVCEKCGNHDEKYIGFRNGKPYCRLCISMKGALVESHKENDVYPVLNLNYSLSKKQEEISRRLIQNFKGGIDTLINAVCGAGKTELVYGVIQYALINNLTVGFAIPRRDVVIELFVRIKAAFPHSKVVAVYGGHTNELDGDIVVLTTHQMFRYPKFFDLLIVDEIDAFPYKGSIELNSILRKSVRGRVIQMSATPDDEVIDYFSHQNREILELNTRFHKHPLPVPKIVIQNVVFQVISTIRLLRKFIKENKQVFVFVPTIEIGANLWIVLRVFVNGGNYVNSHVKNRAQIIENFRVKKFMYLVTTAVLERGVTVKDLQVIVFKGNHDVYNEYNLVQISGRAGRKYDAPKGDVFFLASKNTEAMEKARNTIREKNRYL